MSSMSGGQRLGHGPFGEAPGRQQVVCGIGVMLGFEPSFSIGFSPDVASESTREF